MNHTSVHKDDATVDALNELLRGELSAVESYDKALPALEDKPALRGDLQDCRASHETRAERIRRAIEQVGGEPARASGAWGMFAKAVAGGSRALGWKVVISTLEEGEDHGLKEYKDALPRLHLDEGVRHLIADELYPQQQHTHGVISALKRVMSA
ncbi:MAG TPA: DUF2383 domain-containing protein [Polyangia bacterium]|jgi:uncharacterized protein (TIGR02284 family)|nr:DUF2383 domain-containing protein [Polyangia bacterium]